MADLIDRLEKAAENLRVADEASYFAMREAMREIVKLRAEMDAAQQVWESANRHVEVYRGRVIAGDELLRLAWHHLAMATTGRSREVGDKVRSLRADIVKWRTRHWGDG